MVDYRIGETVKKAKGGNVVVRAIFTTMEGERCYAVENEGALDFVDGLRSRSRNHFSVLGR